MTKRCTACQMSFPATPEYFAPSGRPQPALRSDCRSCRRVRDAASARRRYQPRSPASSAGAEQEPKEVQTLVLLTDVHVPDHDRPAWRAAVSFIKDVQPDEIILMGDFLELGSCSQHGGELDVPSLEDDFQAGRLAIRELSRAAPNADLTFLEGNHESRLERFLIAKAPSLFQSLSVKAGLALEEKGIAFIPEEEQPISRGTLDILHGHQASPRGTLPKHHAAKIADEWASAGRTAVIGHSHRPQTFVKPTGGRGRATGVALGALRTLDPSWLRGTAPAWMHQFAVAYVRPDGHTDLYPITITNGSFAFNGKIYSGKKKDERSRK